MLPRRKKRLGRFQIFVQKLHRQRHAIGFKGLGKEVIRSLLHRLHGAFNRAIGCDHHHRDLNLPPADLLEHLDPVHIRQFDVEQHEVRTGLVQQR